MGGMMKFKTRMIVAILLAFMISSIGFANSSNNGLELLGRADYFSDGEVILRAGNTYHVAVRGGSGGSGFQYRYKDFSPGKVGSPGSLVNYEITIGGDDIIVDVIIGGTGINGSNGWLDQSGYDYRVWRGTGGAGGINSLMLGVGSKGADGNRVAGGGGGGGAATILRFNKLNNQILTASGGKGGEGTYGDSYGDPGAGGNGGSVANSSSISGVTFKKITSSNAPAPLVSGVIFVTKDGIGTGGDDGSGGGDDLPDEEEPIIVDEDLVIGGENIIDVGSIIDSLNPGDIAPFNPEDMQGKLISHNGEVYRLTRNKSEVVKNKNPIDAKEYSFSKEGFGFTLWKELVGGYFEDTVNFNHPGLYKMQFIFRNQNIASDPMKVNYMADWELPEIVADSKVKGQTTVSSDTFTIRLQASDNISPALFYSVDGGTTYYVLGNEATDVTFTGIERTNEGTQNTLTLKVCDINGNVAEKVFTVWGIN